MGAYLVTPSIRETAAANPPVFLATVHIESETTWERR